MVGIELNYVTLNLPVQAAGYLSERYERLMEAIASEHTGNICDEAKALLECVFRTIINNRNGAVDEGPQGHATFIQLYEQAWNSLLTASPNTDFREILKKAAQAVGKMRNEFGGVSHGQDGYDERSLGLAEAMYIARLALSLAGYMYTHHQNVSADSKNARLNYSDNADFNDYIDAEQDVLEVSGILILPSEALFRTDLIAYREKLIEFKDAQLTEQYEADLDAAADFYAEMQSDIERGH